MTSATSKLHDKYLLDHIRSCPKHKTTDWRLCWGTLKRGDICGKRTLEQSLLEFLPVCRTHCGQRAHAAVCSAVLECGFQCGQLLRWKPHDFALCASHEAIPKPCYLLRIPVELRCRIYEYLLPDTSIPAIAHQNGSLLYLRKGQSPVKTAFLRTNRQIHDEAVDMFYGKKTFCVAVGKSNVSMCHTLASAPCTFEPSPGSHCLQDYQMQLMLLGQQNHSRQKLTIQHSSWSIPNIGPSPFPSLIPAPPPQKHFSDPLGPFGPIWRLPLSGRYFDMIRSFHITIEPSEPTSRMPIGNGVRPEIAERELYETCDQLHRLLGRLELVKPSILRLDVNIILDDFGSPEEGIAAAQLLLRPFRRLHQVVYPNACIIWKPSGAHSCYNEIQFSTRELGDEAEDIPFQGFLRRWVSDLSASTPCVTSSSAVLAYWHFRATATEIMSSGRHQSLYTTLDLEGCLKQMRIAREADDLVSLQAAVDDFMVKWTAFTTNQKRLEERMANSVEFISGMLQDIAQESLLPALEEGNKGKAKAEDGDMFPLSWTDQDGTMYTQKDGKVTVRLLTPSLVRYPSSIRTLRRCQRDVANLRQIREARTIANGGFNYQP
jgi:hypothetical protein